MSEYWLERRHKALTDSRNAPTAELRDMYLRVAESCRSLELWCGGTIASSAPYSPFGRV